MEIVSRCVALQKCVMYDASLMDEVGVRGKLQSKDAFNVFLTWGVIGGVRAVKGNVCMLGRC